MTRPGRPRSPVPKSAVIYIQAPPADKRSIERAARPEKVGPWCLRILLRAATGKATPTATVRQPGKVTLPCGGVATTTPLKS